MEAVWVYTSLSNELLTIGMQIPTRKVVNRLKKEFGLLAIEKYLTLVFNYTDKQEISAEFEIYHLLRAYLLYKIGASQLDLAEELTYLDRCQLLVFMTGQDQNLAQLAKKEYDTRYTY